MRTALSITAIALALALLASPVLARNLIWDHYDIDADMGTCLIEDSSGNYWHMFYVDSRCEGADEWGSLPCHFGWKYHYDSSDTILGYEPAPPPTP